MTNEDIIKLAIIQIKKELENGTSKEVLRIKYAEFLENEEIANLLKD